ncbi:DNA-formamidopyrimidine glycosylase family protein [Nakamurella endophytica]|uniref:DNA-formamidopyrimidine glycosylase family protein n=1 Tax=Nakamurella endophytica TaxID=1748367 RepID=UPI001664CF97|nr:DNA-formamidopyrimidine glycosylase family protein [Nakamurella endophytica]
MPEGDTVLRTARRMDQALSGRELLRTDLRWPSLGGVDLAGRPVLETVSYGKHILTRLGAAPRGAARVPTAPDGPLTLRSHLRMDGRWQIVDRGFWPRGGGARVRAVLAGPDWTAVGYWLGLLDLVPTADEPLLIGHLGPDIMADAWQSGDPGDPGDPLPGSAAEGVRRVRQWPDRTIGAALLDQTGVAGIGTMYMAETLFLERISPWTPVREVDVPAVLQRARTLLLHGARSAIPTTTGSTVKGREVWVHARSGKPCHRCGTTVRVAMVGQPPKERTAFFCPVCQPGPAPAGAERVPAPLGSNPAFGNNRNPAGYRPRR